MKLTRKLRNEILGEIHKEGKDLVYGMSDLCYYRIVDYMFYKIIDKLMKEGVIE